MAVRGGGARKALVERGIDEQWIEWVGGDTCLDVLSENVESHLLAAASCGIV